MVKESGTINKENIKYPTVEFLDGKLKKLENYSYAAISGLVIAVILIMLNLRLPAGIIIIFSASACIILIKKTSALLMSAKNSILDFSDSNEKKDDVINDFSHKIREPLNNLVIMSDMLMASGLEGKQMELLETFVASTNNMVSTVNELTMQQAVNISLESRKQIRFNMLATIQNTIELYSLKDKVSIDFILNHKEFSDFECFGDPIALKQIFLDIFNTIENSNSDSPTKVNITLKRDKEDNKETFVDVRIQTDRKITLIDEKNQEHSLAAKLIIAGNGNFRQESAPNSTVLNINLPFSQIITEPRQQIASPKIEELIQKEKAHKVLKDIKILLVEDNLINQKITHLTLLPLVNSIDTASNGKEALDKFGTSNYDLILMDIQMPVMSGLVAAEKIRALEASTNTHVPIIAITANAMLGDKEKCISAGIDDYISKPFQPSALLDKIKKFI